MWGERRVGVRCIVWLGLGMADRESSDHCIKLPNGLLKERLVKVETLQEIIAEMAESGDNPTTASSE